MIRGHKKNSATASLTQYITHTSVAVVVQATSLKIVKWMTYRLPSFGTNTDVAVGSASYYMDAKS